MSRRDKGDPVYGLRYQHTWGCNARAHGMAEAAIVQLKISRVRAMARRFGHYRWEEWDPIESEDMPGVKALPTRWFVKRAGMRFNKASDRGVTMAKMNRRGLFNMFHGHFRYDNPRVRRLIRGSRRRG